MSQKIHVVSYKMQSIHCLLQVCSFAIATTTISGYVLLAANLDDFRSLVKKFAPKIAHQLVDVVSESSVIYRQEPQKKDMNFGRTHETEAAGSLGDKKQGDMNIKYNEYKKETNDVVVENYKSIPVVSLDELIEKTKERLEQEEAEQKQSKQYDYSKQIDENYENKQVKANTKERPRGRLKDRNKWDRKGETEYVTISLNADGNPDKLFEKISMLKKDSYEDYITPEKEDEIFESEEGNKKKPTKLSRAKVKIIATTRARSETKPMKDMKMTTAEYEYYDTTIVTEKLKARTENLLYDDRREDDNTVKKIMVGTMIPTRQVYKMSSPNYYIKLPIIADKYNFNEAIPEKDREPENLKPFGNPPASVNKKVKLIV